MPLDVLCMCLVTPQTRSKFRVNKLKLLVLRIASALNSRNFRVSNQFRVFDGCNHCSVELIRSLNPNTISEFTEKSSVREV